MKKGDRVRLPNGLTRFVIGLGDIEILPIGTIGRIINVLQPDFSEKHPDFHKCSLQIKFPGIPQIGVLEGSSDPILERILEG
jgi:hypothetical protein